MKELNERLERLEQLAKFDKWQSEVVEAARKFVNCKGLYHSEQNTAALIELFKREPK